MKLFRLSAVLVSIAFVLPFAVSQAADWPQYHGPNLNGISSETIKTPWPATGPKVVWKVPTKDGFSSFAIAGGKVFTQVVRDIENAPWEICVALDAATGKELWFTQLAAGRYDGAGNDGAKDNRGGDGPRSTPAVSNGMVYVFTPDLVLHGLDAKTGKKVWAKDLTKEFSARNIGWNNAASPVVDGNLVFVAGGGAGQSLLAFNKKTGEVAWKTLNEEITHSTPTVTTILGQRQVIFFVKSGLVSLATTDGKELWRFPFKFSTSSAISPVVSGDIVYCSAGYGVGGGACRIVKEGGQFVAKELWKTPGNNDVANHWSTPVCKDGYLYGMFSFKKYGSGPMKCVEIATGKIRWDQPGFGAGNVMLVGDKVLALADDGQVVIVATEPATYKELARFKAVDGKCWSTPAFSNGRIYVRSTTEGACLDVSGK